MYWLRYSAHFNPLLSVMQEPTSSTPTARQHTPVKLCAARCLWSTTNSLSLRKSKYLPHLLLKPKKSKCDKKQKRDFLNEPLQVQKKKEEQPQIHLFPPGQWYTLVFFHFSKFNIPISVEGLLRCILDEFADAPNELV